MEFPPKLPPSRGFSRPFQFPFRAFEVTFRQLRSRTSGRSPLPRLARLLPRAETRCSSPREGKPPRRLLGPFPASVGAAGPVSLSSSEANVRHGDPSRQPMTMVGFRVISKDFASGAEADRETAYGRRRAGEKREKPRGSLGRSRSPLGAPSLCLTDLAAHPAAATESALRPVRPPGGGAEAPSRRCGSDGTRVSPRARLGGSLAGAPPTPPPRFLAVPRRSAGKIRPGSPWGQVQQLEAFRAISKDFAMWIEAHRPWSVADHLRSHRICRSA